MLVISKHQIVERGSVTGGKRNPTCGGYCTPESFGCWRVIVHVTGERADLRRLGLRLGPQSRPFTAERRNLRGVFPFNVVKELWRSGDLELRRFMFAVPQLYSTFQV